MTGATHEVPGAASALVVEAASLATQGAGGAGVTVTGTLQETGPGTRQFSYAAAPADKLVVRYGNGTTLEVTVATFTTASTTFAGFFDENHDLRFRYVVTPGGTDIQVVQQRTGNGTNGSVVGTLPLDGVSYAVNVSRTGTITATVDSGFAESIANDTLGGTITAPGFSVQQVETRYSRYVVYMGTQTQNIIRNASSTFSVNGVSYDFLNAEVRKAFVNVAPGDLEYWRAEGTLRRNGGAIGGLQLAQDAASIRVVLTVNGVPRDLDVHPR